MTVISGSGHKINKKRYYLLLSIFLIPVALVIISNYSFNEVNRILQHSILSYVI